VGIDLLLRGTGSKLHLLTVDKTSRTAEHTRLSWSKGCGIRARKSTSFNPVRRSRSDWWVGVVRVVWVGRYIRHKGLNLLR